MNASHVAMVWWQGEDKDIFAGHAEHDRHIIGCDQARWRELLGAVPAGARALPKLFTRRVWHPRNQFQPRLAAIQRRRETRRVHQKGKHPAQ
jgi:hypothetical protein